MLLDLTNHFLIAMPALEDPNFARTVTYVCAHNQDGAMGIVINRPLEFDLGEVLQQLKLASPRLNADEVSRGFRPQSKQGEVVERDC